MKTNFEDLKKLEGDQLEDTVVNLSGEELDNAVSYVRRGFIDGRNYSSDWGLAGPIIEECHIILIYYGTWGVSGMPWEAEIGSNINYIDQYSGDAIPGATPLEAAMRCYVLDKLEKISGDK